MAVYELIKVDLAPIILKAGEAHQGKAKAKGADKPIFSKCEPLPFDIAVPFEGKHEKYITKDEVLKKKLAEFKSGMAQTIYKNLLKVIDTRVAAYADSWKPGNDAAFEALGKGLNEARVTYGQMLYDACFKIVNDYMVQVKEGKIAIKKYQTKTATGFLKVGASLAGVGVAVAGAVGSHGATTPAVILACYGTYKSVKEVADTLHAWHKGYAAHGKSAQETLEVITKRYKESKWASQEAATAAGETLAKLADEFLKKEINSIKKLESDIKHFARHVDMGFVSVHKIGKTLTKMKTELEGALKELEKNKANMEAKAKLLPPGVVQPYITKLDKAISILKTEHDQKFGEKEQKAAVIEQECTEHKATTIPDLEKACAELKSKRPGWVAQVGNVARLVPIAAGAACADFSSLATGGMTAVNEGVQLATSAISDFIQTYGPNVIAAAKKAAKK